MGFSRREHWSGLPCPPPGDLPDPGIKPGRVSYTFCICRRGLYHWHHLGNPGCLCWFINYNKRTHFCKRWHRGNWTWLHGNLCFIHWYIHRVFWLLISVYFPTRLWCLHTGDCDLLLSASSVPSTIIATEKVLRKDMQCAALERNDSILRGKEGSLAWKWEELLGDRFPFLIN